MGVQRRSLLALGAAGVVGGGVAWPGAADAAGSATRTERLYLTGLDKDRTVDWEFMVATGRNSGVWSTIPTPSNWEMQGFGTIQWGWNLMPEEIGRYRHTFEVPAGWRDRRTYIVFEGSMTDTDVWINGRSAGPTHRGGFYEFRYDVTELLAYGQSNLLEATVRRESTDDSVNQAERRGDYWNFSGIYRPVHLRSTPAEFVDRLAVDARADGSFTVDAYVAGVSTADRVVAQITTLQGAPVGRPFSAPVTAGAEQVRLATTATGPKLWSAETPHLYRVTVSLHAGAEELHRTDTRFGFRTIEVRVGDGVYLNGEKIVLKGTNRHTFWPTSGRTMSPALDRQDIMLMKEMNNNAVRMSHYPPDARFLDLCDELGLYVLDELAGWQKSYSAAAAAPLVREMVIRDVNHPSIVFWDNGNEGGWQTAVDDDFHLYDPQKRAVLHPWALFSGIDTDHYENYTSTQAKLAGPNIFMSTEFLHGLYDGGAGAGLHDYWALMGTAPRSAGGFIWAFADEGIVRADRGGVIDVTGNSAPDGILGPFRQKEASFFTVRDIWSPVQITERAALDAAFPAGFTGAIGITNTYDFINTRQCRFAFKLLKFPGPLQRRTGHTVTAGGVVASPDIAPGRTGTLHLPLPGSWRSADALSLTATGPDGRELCTWTWTIKKAADHAARIVPAATRGRAVSATDSSGDIVMRAGDTEVTIAAATGRLASVLSRGTRMALTDGPVLSTGTAELTGITHRREGRSHLVEASYAGDLAYARWRLDPSGWLRLEYQYSLTGPHDYFGVDFSLPEAEVTGVTWLGHGPYRVWKNRLRGVTTDVWSKEYNDTATGAELWEYPEFKGYHANTYWARLHTRQGAITMVAGEENLFLRLFTPRNGWDPRNTAVPFPARDISFLDAIPAIGTKFDPATALGPQSQPAVATGDYRRRLAFHFARGE